MSSTQVEKIQSGDHTVFFAPHAVIEFHAEFEKLLADFSAERSKRVTLVGCDQEFFGGCHPHLSRPDDDQHLICQSCVHTRLQLDKKRTYTKAFPNQLLTNEDYEWVEEELQKTRQTPVGQYSVEGVPLGKYWTFDLTLERKSNDFIGQAADERYLGAARAGLLAYRVGKRVLEALVPHAVVVYSVQYSLNRSFASAFRNSGVGIYNVRQNGPLNDRGSRFIVSEGLQTKPLHLENRFASALTRRLSGYEKSIVWRHARSQITARTALTYSSGRAQISAAQIRKKVGLPEGSRVVGFLLSSPDEPIAANSADLLQEGLLIDRDYFWISQMFELARKTPDVFFVFRLHPRLAPNRREARESPELKRILHILDEQIESVKNIVRNTPDDGIGLYDLAMILDCVFSYRTSSAFELGLLGIPTVQLEPSRDPLLSLHNSPVGEAEEGTRLISLLDEALSPQSAYEITRSHARLSATNLVRMTNRIGYTRGPLLDRAVGFFVGVISKVLKKAGMRGVGRYSGIRLVGDRFVRPRKKDRDVPAEIFRQWQEQVTLEQTSAKDEIRNILWLRKKLRRTLRPLDGSEPFLRESS